MHIVFVRDSKSMAGWNHTNIIRFDKVTSVRYHRPTGVDGKPPSPGLQPECYIFMEGQDAPVQLTGDDAAAFYDVYTSWLYSSFTVTSG